MNSWPRGYFDKSDSAEVTVKDNSGAKAEMHAGKLHRGFSVGESGERDGGKDRMPLG